METQPLIEAHHISKRHGEHMTVNRVTLAIGAGEIVTIIGPNGAGKTTLLRMLVGLEQPDDGHIHLKEKLRIGYMPQQLSFPPSIPMTVAWFLKFFGGKDAASLARVVAEVGVEDLLSQSIHSLSGGELRRVMFARALLNNPELLVLDEPMADVDVNGQAELYKLIETTAKARNCAVLMVSHDLHVVMASTHRVVCLHHHICCEGAPQHVNQNPEFIALFGHELAARLALYHHHHDHTHDLHGDVVCKH